ncbi:hypothetical protein LMG7974_01941 [Campylobacter majalis]|uniref:Uncharacterized protein n=1 Tax=Campylobacter majalis TaxID=2790656 RepID=A0ABN7KCQ1_9BACT|nr:hypothetical protein LMG7974_01941 [Campylobacter majalis]
MNDISNAFWRELGNRAIIAIVQYANQYPIVAWLILYVLGLFVLYFCLKIIYCSFDMYKMSKNIRNIKIIFISSLPIMIYFFFIIKFTIYRSYGYLLYFCIFTWISTFVIMFFSFKYKTKSISSNITINKRKSNKRSKAK